MGDIRLDRLSEKLAERVMKTGSLVLKTLGGTRKAEVATGRFLANDAVDPAMIPEPHIARTEAAIAGRSILVVQDTTEINFSGRAARRKNLGPAGDGVSPGLFIHPQVAVDAEHGAVLGLIGAEIWTRPEGRAGDRKKRLSDDKESRRWLTGAETAAARCSGAARVVVVGDRESDIYALFAERPANIHLLVRATQDRSLAEGSSLKAISQDWPILDVRTVDVPARRVGASGGPWAGRKAKIAIKRPVRARQQAACGHCHARPRRRHRN